MCARFALSVSIEMRSPMKPACSGLFCAVRFGIESVVTRSKAKVGDGVAGFVMSAAVTSLHPVNSQLPNDRS
jgi:hypothetical protein